MLVPAARGPLSARDSAIERKSTSAGFSASLTTAPQRIIFSTSRVQPVGESRCCSVRSAPWQIRHARLNTASPSAARLCEATGTGAKCAVRYASRAGRSAALTVAPQRTILSISRPQPASLSFCERDEVAAVAAQAARLQHVRARTRPAARTPALAGAGDCAEIEHVEGGARSRSSTLAPAFARREQWRAGRGARNACPRHYFTSTRTLSYWFHR